MVINVDDFDTHNNLIVKMQTMTMFETNIITCKIRLVIHQIFPVNVVFAMHLSALVSVKSFRAIPI